MLYPDLRQKTMRVMWSIRKLSWRLLDH